MQAVKTWHQQSDSTSEAYNCTCPPPCHSITFETYYSISQFPGMGPELGAAYQRIVQKKVIPYYKSLNGSLAAEALGYFSDTDNKEEIMKNFIRFTLYIKDLTVEIAQQVPAYGLLDLLSDMGKYSGYRWEGVVGVGVGDGCGWWVMGEPAYGLLDLLSDMGKYSGYRWEGVVGVGGVFG